MPFTRTLASLSRETSLGWSWTVLVGTGLLATWLTWAFVGRLSVYETSRRARLEVASSVHPIDALVAGRVARLELAIGRRVESGALLVELDTEIEQRQLAEERTRQAALRPQLEALRRELAAEEESITQDRHATRSAVAELRAREREAHTQTRFARQIADRYGQLHRGGGTTEIEKLRASSEAEKNQAAEEALGLQGRRLEAERRTRESQARGRVEQLRREEARLTGDLAALDARVEMLSQRIRRAHLRAAVSGRVAEVSSMLQVGTVVREGDRLGAILPDGQLRVVSHFSPGAALGKIRPGQLARLQLDGFPWPQYPLIEARVERVASELRQGQVRVELAVASGPREVALEHGLPGVLEVEVERTSPAILVLRAIGQRMLRPFERPAGEPAAGPAEVARP
jgi:membrane fusion protein (multidrug efflux system)